MNRNQACQLGLTAGEALVLANPTYWPEAAPIFAIKSAVLRLRTTFAALRLDSSGELMCFRDELLPAAWRHVQRFSPNRTDDEAVRLGYEFILGAVEQLRAVVAVEDTRRPSDRLGSWFELGMVIVNGEWIETMRLGRLGFPEPAGDGYWCVRDRRRLDTLLAAVDLRFDELTVRCSDESGNFVPYFDALPSCLTHWCCLETALLLRADTPAEMRVRAPVYDYDPRDEWLYARSLNASNTWRQIREDLSAEHPEWEQIDSNQGVRDAVRRYARRHRLDRPPRRRPGRRPNSARASAAILI